MIARAMTAGLAFASQAGICPDAEKVPQSYGSRRRHSNCREKEIIVGANIIAI